MLLTGKTGGYHGYRQQTERTACFKRTDAGGTGGPFRAFQGIYFPAGAQSYLPSITTLMDILQCLGTSIGEFFNEAPDEQIVFGKQDYFVKEDTEYKNEIKWIIPNAQKNTIEPIYLTLQAGGSTCPDTPHEGEEFGYVLQGAVSIHLGNKTYKAKKGESFYYTADKTHFLSSKNGATLIWVSSPPSF